MAGFSPGGFHPLAGGFGAQAARNTSQFNPTGLGLPAPVAQPYTPTQQQTATGLIEGSPGYVAAQNNAQYAQQTGAAARQGGIQGAYADYGGPLPAGFHDQYGDLSPDMVSQVGADPYTAYAQAQRQNAQDIVKMRQQEAAGLGESSQMRIDAQNQDNAYGMHLRSLGDSFMNAVNTALSNYTGVLQKNSSDISNAVLRGQDDLSKNPTFTGILGHKPHLSPSMIGF